MTHLFEKKVVPCLFFSYFLNAYAYDLFGKKMQKNENIPKILVVDDMPDLRFLVQSILLQQGYTVLVAHSGAHALELLQQIPDINLVLLDIMMPDLSGIETLSLMNQFRQARKLKVAFLTGIRAKDEIARGMQMKPDDFILKPIDPALLKNKVRAMLREDFKDHFLPPSNVSFHAQLVDTLLNFKFLIVQMSEFDIVLDTPINFNIGKTFQFNSLEMNTAISFEHTFNARVKSSQNTTATLFRVKADLIQVPDNVLRHLRNALYDSHF